MARYFRWNPARGADSLFGGSKVGRFLQAISKPTRGTVTSLYYKVDAPTATISRLVHSDPERAKPKVKSVSIKTQVSDLNKYFNNLEKRNHCLSQWICMRAAATTYALPEGGYIWKEDNKGAQSIIVSSPSAPARGNTSLAVGEKVWATFGNKSSTSKRSPLHLMRGNDTGNVVPLSLAGNKFGFYSNRYGGSMVSIYALRACKVSVVDDPLNRGFDNVTPTDYNFTAGQLREITISTEETRVLISSSDDIIVSVREVGGGDRMMVPPCSQYFYVRRQGYQGTFHNGTGPTRDTNFLVYYSSKGSDRVWSTEIADGAGGDSTCGLGVEFLGNRFTYGDTLSDYAIIAPFGDTTVTVKYHDLSHGTAKWQSLNEHVLTGGTPIAPAAVFADGNGTVSNKQSGYNDSGSAPEFASGAVMWWFESTKPIHVVINTPSNDEETLLGWTGRNTRSDNWLTTLTEIENYLITPDDDYILYKT